MSILIIGKAKVKPDETVRDYYQKYVDFFDKSAKTASVEASIGTSLFDDLIITVGDGEFSIYDTKNDCDINSYQAIFIRGDALRDNMDVVAAINEYANIHNIPVINDYSNVRDSSKLLQAVNFHKLSVPVAKTLLVNDAALTKADLNWLFPCVMKAIHGSHGNDNHMVRDMDEVRSILAKTPGKKFVLQRFVPNDCDYRILVIGNDTLVIRRSAVGDSHLNNTSQGGQAELVDNDVIPEGIMRDVKKITDYYGMTIAGIDVFSDKNTSEFFFLEVNSQPQLMTGAFLDKKEELVGKLLKELSDQD